MNEKEVFCFYLMGAIEENADKIKVCTDAGKAVIGLHLMRREYTFSDEELNELCEYSSLNGTLLEELEEILERKIEICVIYAHGNGGYADVSLTLFC